MVRYVSISVPKKLLPLNRFLDHDMHSESEHLVQGSSIRVFFHVLLDVSCLYSN